MKKAIIIGIITIFLLPCSLSWSLQKGAEIIYFDPGLEKTIPFVVDNYDGPTKLFFVEVSTTSEELKGILDQVVHIKEPELMIEKGKKGEFHADITLPNELSYGLYNIFIKILSDDPNEKKGQIRIRKALGFDILVYSLYPGKLVAATLKGPASGNIGELLYFRTTVRNIGTENIENARAKIDIYQDDILIDTVYSDYMPIASKYLGKFKANLLVAESYKIGQYVAKAVVEYDGNTEDAKYISLFNIGHLSIGILNITSRKFENNKINKFDIIVESKWNKPADAYANIILTDLSGVEITKFKTETVTVGGWRKGKVPVYFDAKGIENGNYMLKVILNYEEKTSQRKFVVYVGEVGDAEIVDEMPSMPKTTIMIIALVVVVVLLVGIVIFMMFFKRKKVKGESVKVKEEKVESNDEKVKDNEIK